MCTCFFDKSKKLKICYIASLHCCSIEDADVDDDEPQ